MQLSGPSGLPGGQGWGTTALSRRHTVPSVFWDFQLQQWLGLGPRSRARAAFWGLPHLLEVWVFLLGGWGEEASCKGSSK